MYDFPPFSLLYKKIFLEEKEKNDHKVKFIKNTFITNTKYLI